MNHAPLEDTTRTISWVSYVLHLVVAVSAVVPGAQMGPLLLIVAWVMDLVKRGDISANVEMKPGDILIIPQGWF